VRLSYCVVNTGKRELLLACLDAIERTTPAGLAHEVLVLDNASCDGSVEAVLARGGCIRLLAREVRAGKAENDSTLLEAARGEYCLLLNEDAELLPGAVQNLVAALDGDPGAAVAGARLLFPDGRPQQCAWRPPGVATAIAGALFLHKLLTVQSRGGRTREVGWTQSSAMLVRRSAAEQVNWLDPDFFVYSDETDFCKRLRDAGWRILWVPAAQAFHHDQLASDGPGARRRIVEFQRNRDRYMRKHHSRAAAALVRWLSAWSYLVRALVSRHHSERYLLHARQALRPWQGEGIREVAAQQPATPLPEAA
jgi:N-acetylglucosaminyl-diphospho-decaprenol L-rhamnosyltransferase